MGKSCVDCYHLKARIPLKHRNGTYSIFSEMDFNEARVTCSQGYITLMDGSDRLFKNVLRKKIPLRLKAFRHAERCPDYDE